MDAAAKDPGAPDADIVALMTSARDARLQAYCPYSKFKVGAALLCTDGTVYTGVNVENASYGLTVCAERVAIATAVTQGHHSFKAIAVCCDTETFTAPCGACRQVIVEFGTEIEVFLVQPNLNWQRMRMDTLLPLAFTPASLEQARHQLA
jgi:cytidine deaminase